MSNEEARRIVQSGLNRRKAEREKAAKEARLEKYEQDMIVTCNEHSADVKMKRQREEIRRRNREEFQARCAARAESLAKELAREEAAIAAVKKYVVACMAILCLTIFTYLPMWAAVTLALTLAVFPSAYIFRLYFPLEG